jgi:hypothetical protein
MAQELGVFSPGRNLERAEEIGRFHGVHTVILFRGAMTTRIAS